jgi:hypothetical protein
MWLARHVASWTNYVYLCVHEVMVVQYKTILSLIALAMTKPRSPSFLWESMDQVSIEYFYNIMPCFLGGRYSLHVNGKLQMSTISLSALLPSTLTTTNTRMVCVSC